MMRIKVPSPMYMAVLSVGRNLPYPHFVLRKRGSKVAERTSVCALRARTMSRHGKSESHSRRVGARLLADA
jgi:hypothetical protein